MRLRLNWDLRDVESRRDFINQYTQNWPFKSEPTDEELEMMGNYILWGKKLENDKNAVQDHEIQISTKNGHWNTGHEEDSLDELLETPTFNEGVILSNTATPLRTPREVFNRQVALNAAPQVTREILQDLFKRIDEIDLCVNFYDLKSGKRINPPREELISSFTEEEISHLKQIGENWTSRKYLMNRHLLVELRREQYTIRDTYMPIITRHTPRPSESDITISFGDDIPVLPVGTFNKVLFKDFDQLNPFTYSEEELQIVSAALWQKIPEGVIFNFEDLENVYNLLDLYYEVEEQVERSQAMHLPQSTSDLFETLNYYIRNTILTDAQREILELKLKKVKNEDIANYINNKYNKSYTINYISTIYRQKIIPAINETARRHKYILQNLFFPENFKQCTGCGRILLKDNINFVSKARSKDGFNNRCKVCDKKSRELKKSEELLSV